jgi:hypothetical protein
VTRSLGCGSCFFGGDPRSLAGLAQQLLLLSEYLERLPMLVRDLAGFFCELPESFRFIPYGFACNAMLFGELTIFFRRLTAVLTLRAPNLRLLSMLL